jgi:hypothetical protein
MFQNALVIATSAILVATAPAAAQQQLCTERQVVLSQLSKQYSEALVAMGCANNGGVLEVLSSGAGKSWTIILTMPNGVTSVLAAGDSWEALPVMAQIDPAA